MTENEAKLLEKLDELANDTEVDMYSVANLNFFFEESANTIRKLIEEIQSYRAIGTTPTRILELVGGLNIELSKYAEIGTVEEFKALKEKNVIVTQDDIDTFKAYINDCVDDVAFGNTDWNHSLALALKCMEVHKT